MAKTVQRLRALLISFLLVWTATASMLSSSDARAMVPYDSASLNEQSGTARLIQPLYAPDLTVSGTDIPGGTFKAVNDLFIDHLNRIYVVDTNNNRVVQLDEQGRFSRLFDGADDVRGRLLKPEGVFVTDEGWVYIADTGHRRVVVYHADGHFIKEFTQPQSVYLPADYTFAPTKLIVDRRGTIYSVVRGSYQGLFRMNKDGVFTGFYGASPVRLTLLDRLKRLVLSKEQIARDVSKLPAEIDNVALAPEGWILTVESAADSPARIHKLNAAGRDQFGMKPFPFAGLLNAIDVDRQGFIYTLEPEYGQVTIYDPEGLSLFQFGGVSKASVQRGVMSYPTDLAVDRSGNLWIADGTLLTLQRFALTAFGERIMTALDLQLQGYYSENIENWEQVYRYNEQLDLIYKGFGNAYAVNGEYERALSHFKLALDPKAYSGVFWEVRLVWIREHATMMLGALVALLVGWLAVRRMSWYRSIVQLPGLRGNAVFQGAQLAGRLLFHPYEQFHKLKEGGVSSLFLLLFLTVCFAIRLAEIYWTGFLFHPVDAADIRWKYDMALMFVPLFTWMAANYLINTIRDGEGKLLQVIQGSILSMVPYAVFTLPVIALSHVLVLEERIIYDIMQWVSWIWVAVLFFVMNQVIHGHDFLETIGNLLLSLFTVLMIWLFALIVYGLSYQLWDFVMQLYKEANLRGI